MSTEDENQPVPNWLLKLEEQRERRLKVKLGHEAGAGAKCQKCEDKCPGLDLHFWRKICKACKCGKEDHDIIDDDFCGFVHFQLLGSKPVKSKGVFLKGRKDEVILEWTPKGSSNDIKKYLDELPADMIPVKGSEGAKIRKQRLQKQMPAHDIDATLCHQLTENEIKEMEEYVSHIRKNCVGQGKIIRLSLFKGSQHKIPPSNSQFLSQIPPAQIASSQTVFLQSSDMANNLQNLSIRDNKNVPLNQGSNDPNSTTHAQKPSLANFAAQNVHPIVDNQNPSGLGKMTDMNYYPNQQSLKNVVHPLTTSNVERHQEQYEIQNANFDKILNPHLNYAPNYLNPVEQHQLPSQVGQPKDLKYPVGTNYEPQVGNFENQNVPRYNNANVDKIANPLMQYNPSFVNPVDQAQIPTQVGQPKDVKYPTGVNPPPINTSTHPLMQRNTPGGATQEMLNPNYSTMHNANAPLQQYNPNFVNPTENVQLPSQVGQLTDLKYPSLDQNKPVNANQIGQYPNYPIGPNGESNLGHPDLKYNTGTQNSQNLEQMNPVNANQMGQYPNYQIGPNGEPKNADQINPINSNQMGQYPNYPIGPNGEPIYPSGTQNVGQINPINANQMGQYPNYPIGPNGEPKNVDQINPINANQMGQYPNYPIGPNGKPIYPSGAQNVDQMNPINANQMGQYPNYSIGPNGEPIYPSGTQNVDQMNPINANQMGQYPNYQIGPNGEPIYPSGTQNVDQMNPINANQIEQYSKLGHPRGTQNVDPANANPIGQYPSYPIGQSGDVNLSQTPYNIDPTQETPGYNQLQHPDLKPKPIIPILEAQSAINPFESHQNLQSVGYIRDIDYPPNSNSNLPPKSATSEPLVPSMDQNFNQPAVNQKCHNCKGSFEDGCVAISVDRTNNLWHAKCFNCDSCKQPLADLLYFYHKENDNIYCGRDYAILKGIPRCLACDELIFVREYCLAEDNTFHIKHFCCFECDEPLAGKQYIMENNQPVCISCYENLKAEKCNDCSLTIRPDQQGVSLQNLHWHAEPECFACKKCRKSLLGSKMLLRNQNLFCSDVCFKSF